MKQETCAHPGMGNGNKAYKIRWYCNNKLAGQPITATAPARKQDFHKWLIVIIKMNKPFEQNEQYGAIDPLEHRSQYELCSATTPTVLKKRKGLDVTNLKQQHWSSL